MTVRLAKLTLLTLLTGFVLCVDASWAMDKAEVEAIIREYIKNHPAEMLEAMQRYQIEQRKAQEEESLKLALAQRVEVPLAGSPSMGPEDAKFTIVEFSDFQCPYCARSVGTINALMQKLKGTARLVFKNAPLPFHAKAPDAALAAMAARAQGKFWEYREKLMATQNEWGQSADTKASFIKYAKEMGMDAAKFEKEMANPAHKKTLEADKALAEKLGVGGTPTYFVNGVRVVGAQELSYFDRVIAELTKGKNL